MIVERSFVQGSDAWFAARAGSPGASSLGKIITSTGKPSTQRKAYLYQMAGEKILGKKEESFKSAAMARGTEMEPEARECFCGISGLEVEEVAMCYADELKLFHCSPDGLIVARTVGWKLRIQLYQLTLDTWIKGCCRLNTNSRFKDQWLSPGTHHGNFSAIIQDYNHCG